jgi:aldehyde:ferredoxin oxidoreductase
MDGFYNKVLHIDLSTRSYKEKSIEDHVHREYLGGKGLGTYLLMNHTKAGVDPLSEDNVLILP